MADFEKIIEWKVEGFAELEQQLLALANEFPVDTVVRQTVVKALKRAVQPVAERAIALAPYDSENPRSAYRPIHMKDTIKFTARIPLDSDMESVYFEPGAIALGIVSVKKSAVSLANEFGTSRRGARPFLRRALSEEREKVVDILAKEMAEIVPAYAKRMARRRK